MPDANLRTAVRSVLDIDAGDTLTQADMEDLTSLTARDSEISSITGLAHATNLTSLDLRDNSIATISALSGLTSLETLKLKGNSIDNISALSNLMSLTLLNLKDNDIVTITALSGLTNLEHLRLDGNSITDVQPLTSLVNLEKLWIAGNSLTNAHLLSSLTNLTTIDITIPDPPDTTAPDVSISVPSGTQNGAFDATITFTEVVSDFVQADLSLGGTAIASITAWDTTDNTVFTATITPTTSGTVILDIAADVATDAASNGNTAATTESVTVEIIPDPATWMPDANLRTAVRSALDINAGDTLTQASMLNLSSLQAKDAGIMDLSGLEHAMNLTRLRLSVNSISSITPLKDLPNLEHLNLYSNQLTDLSPLSGLESLISLDIGKNTITDTDALSGLTHLTSLYLDGNTLTDFSNLSSLTGLSMLHLSRTGISDLSVLGDLTNLTRLYLTGNEISGISGLSALTKLGWLFLAENQISDVSPLVGMEDLISLRLLGNPVSNASVLYPLTQRRLIDVDIDILPPADTESPSVTIAVPSDTQKGAFDVTITFSEVVSDFLQADLTVTGTATTTITAWSADTDHTVYTATITPTTSGSVTFNVAADVATDAADNPNTAATEQTANVDLDAPSISISVPSGTQNGAFDVTITFTEVILDFVQTDLSLGGTATASITDWSATDNTIFTAEITPTTSGTVTLDIAADVATDAANNNNTAALTQTLTVNVDAPNVIIDVPSETQNGVFTATITFTETVSDFVQGDLSLGGIATASITDWNTTDNTVFTATITPITSGTVTLDIAADVATDAANNNNTAALTQTVTVDVDAPSVTISVPSGTQNSAFDVTITFTESVYNFVQDDLSLEGSTATATITAWSADTDNAVVYTATITPTMSGTVVLNVAADVATDAADNANTAATEQTVTILFMVVPDANLAAKIRAKLLLADDVEITVANLQSLTDLDAQSRQIQNITGLEHATNLTSLNIGRNAITDITPLGGLTNLTELFIHENPIRGIAPLANLSNLELLWAFLAFRSNDFDDDLTPLAGLLNLKKLTLSGNFISDLTVFSGLTKLEQLGLSDNSISDSDIALLDKLTKLTNLNLNFSHESITDLTPLGGLTELRNLQIKENSISDITPLGGLTELRNLQIKENSISDITPLANLTKLEHLSLENNPILDTSPLYPLLQANGGEIAHIDIEVSQYPPWDVNEDGNVDATDESLVQNAIGQSGDTIENSRTDVNGDSTVDTIDKQLVTDNLDEEDDPDAQNANGAPPSLEQTVQLLDPTTLKMLDRETLKTQLDFLRAESDGSLKYLQAIALLENILAATRPKETVLLSNYPNPFNPETWIPYHLANPSDVQITIYDTRGSVVRRLDLGHQREGYYTSRGRAAYWDGTNNVGERVASGIYFYQFQADNRSLLRKMLILK